VAEESDREVSGVINANDVDADVVEESDPEVPGGINADAAKESNPEPAEESDLEDP